MNESEPRNADDRPSPGGSNYDTINSNPTPRTNTSMTPTTTLTPGRTTSTSHAALIARMKAIVGPDNVLTSAADMAAYECDGFTIAKTKPEVVVFPTSTEQIVGIVKTCAEFNIGFLARGAGTSLAGGCVLVG